MRLKAGASGSQAGHPARFVAYYRVSTAQQGASGLGLDAQREAVARHSKAAGGIIVAEFREIESGKKNDRPEIAKRFGRVDCAARR
jgi:DNA invertase Pin-like site-specific DNA recombinase